MAVVRSWFWFPIVVVISTGCTSEIEQHPNLVSDRETESGAATSDAPSSQGASGATAIGRGTSGTPAAGSCDAGANWEARGDFTVESAPGRFGDEIETLVRASRVSPIAVSSHIDANCVWSVAFSAADDVTAQGTKHATTFTPMLRHPAGLWTAAPQSSGWLRVVDAASQTIWIPLVDATGSATYGEATCASLTDVHVTAIIPSAAGSISLVTSDGTRTLGSLLGAPYGRGWDVRFAFSADSSH